MPNLAEKIESVFSGLPDLHPSPFVPQEGKSIDAQRNGRWHQQVVLPHEILTDDGTESAILAYGAYHPRLDTAVVVDKRPEGYQGPRIIEGGGGGSVTIPYSVKDGQILLGVLMVKRMTVDGGSIQYYELPRGFKRKIESHETAGKREAQTEAGITVPQRDALGLPTNWNTTYDVTNPSQDSGVHWYSAEFNPEAIDEHGRLKSEYVGPITESYEGINPDGLIFMPLSRLPYNVVDQFTWTAAGKLYVELTMDSTRRDVMHGFRNGISQLVREKENRKAYKKVAEALVLDPTKQPEGFDEKTLSDVQDRADEIEAIAGKLSNTDGSNIPGEDLYRAVRQSFAVEQFILDETIIGFEISFLNLFTNDEYRGREERIQKMQEDLAKITQRRINAETTFNNMMGELAQKA